MEHVVRANVAAAGGVKERKNLGVTAGQAVGQDVEFTGDVLCVDINAMLHQGNGKLL